MFETETTHDSKEYKRTLKERIESWKNFPQRYKCLFPCFNLSKIENHSNFSSANMIPSAEEI